MTRSVALENGEFYHVYNRGVDKRNVFMCEDDIDRFSQSMKEFNVVTPIGSIFEQMLRKRKFGNETPKTSKEEQLVRLIAFCLNPNHYHFIIEQLVDGGISAFMKRLNGGYTNYFNLKYKRSGSLFQGVFQARHIGLNNYLLHLSAYVNLNYRVHRLPAKLLRTCSTSSWEEYLGIAANHRCAKEIVLGQFRDTEEYKNFAEDSLREIIKQKQLYRELGQVLFKE